VRSLGARPLLLYLAGYLALRVSDRPASGRPDGTHGDLSGRRIFNCHRFLTCGITALSIREGMTAMPG
jgi:hypothetical protein